MGFDDFDKQMRLYEQSLDQYITPETYIIARLDGRAFTKLTKETRKFETPFDIQFRNLMTDTVKSLMRCGFRVIYGYTESDEISLLFHPDDNTFGRNVRKINSTLAGEASAAFSMALGKLATFDCRVVPLPNKNKVVDYFIWRQLDATRNSLNSWCYWTLRKEGMDKNQATKELENKNVGYKNELLFQRGVNFNNIPSWQKRGIGLYQRNVSKTGYNPIENKTVTTERNEIFTDYDLPFADKYKNFLNDILTAIDPVQDNLIPTF